MSSIIHLGCPGCARELESAAADPGPATCPACGAHVPLGKSPAVRSGEQVDVCAVCGHPDMYIQKDFNRNLGLSIVVAGVLASLVFFGMEEPLLAVGALVLMALVDGVIYLGVGEVTVCYSCHAIYRGFGSNPAHRPFDLELLERFGGRPPRH